MRRLTIQITIGVNGRKHIGPGCAVGEHIQNVRRISTPSGRCVRIWLNGRYHRSPLWPAWLVVCVSRCGSEGADRSVYVVTCTCRQCEFRGVGKVPHV